MDVKVMCMHSGPLYGLVMTFMHAKHANNNTQWTMFAHIPSRDMEREIPNHG